jgi:hypothetical protein
VEEAESSGLKKADEFDKQAIVGNFRMTDPGSAATRAGVFVCDVGEGAH